MKALLSSPDLLSRGPEPADLLSAYSTLLEQRHVLPSAKPHFLRWAKSWLLTTDPEFPTATLDFFQTLGRRPRLQDWQFQQAVRAVAWLTRDIMRIPWAASFDWRGLADQAKTLEPNHRTHGREASRVTAPNPSLPTATDAPHDISTKTAGICEKVRRAVRLGGLSYSTEQTYVQWVSRFTRFCLIRLKQHPQNASTDAITCYLNYLALERNVSSST